MRDLDKKPYSADEMRVAKFFSDMGVGGGDDPIGALIASHQGLALERNLLVEQDRALRAAVNKGLDDLADVLKGKKRGQVLHFPG